MVRAMSVQMNVTYVPTTASVGPSEPPGVHCDSLIWHFFRTQGRISRVSKFGAQRKVSP
jgi:hypothetical protein